MKVAHWTWGNKSGMHRVAESIVKAEKGLGVDSRLVWTDSKTEDREWALTADIHMAHTHISEDIWNQRPRPPVIWLAHGTPEVIFHEANESARMGGYGAGDPLMLVQYWMQNADAMVTFWPRHEKIWKSLCDRNTIVRHIPLGLDKEEWKPQVSAGKFAGNPALLSAENCYEIKWPLDLVIAWPWVQEEITKARLHLTYLPANQHRCWFPLINRNGSSFSSYASSKVFGHAELRNAFASVDYYIGLVRYGDFNRLSLEAKACGCTLISYIGNPYADYWIPEGDQRIIADVLISILRGEVEKRQTAEVPDIAVTAVGLMQLYTEVLERRLS
jgi:hypothetical protein